MKRFNQWLCLCATWAVIILLLTTLAIADEKINVKFKYGHPKPYYAPGDTVRLSATLHDVDAGGITNIEITGYIGGNLSQCMYSRKIEGQEQEKKLDVDLEIPSDIDIGRGNISVVVKYYYYHVESKGRLQIHEGPYHGQETYILPLNIISPEEKAERDAKKEAQKITNKYTGIELVVLILFTIVMFVIPLIVIALIIRWLYRKLR
jgi:hypothetical protein